MAFATREAASLYDQAEQVVEKLGDAVDVRSIMAIHQAKINLFFILSDFERSQREGERLLVIARKVGDRISEGAALAGMGRAALWAHDFDRALEYSRQAIEVASGVDAKPVMAGGHLVTGVVYEVTARLEPGARELQRALTVSREAGDVLNESLSLCFMGLAANWAGNYDEASRIFSEAMRIVEKNNLLMPRVMGLFMHGITLTAKGNYDQALQIFEQGLTLSEKVGDEVNRHRLLNSLGWLYSEIGDLDRAMDLNRQGAEGARKRGDPETIANPEINLGDIFLMKGDLVLAQELLEGVHRLVKNPATSDWMRWRYSTHLFASLGELWLARGDHAKALEFCGHCLDIATRTNSKKNLVKGWRLKGEIALIRRQFDEAENTLQRGLGIAQAIGNPTQLWKTHVALGRLFSDRKDPVQAERAYNAARGVIDGIKANLRNSELRASLENAPMIRKIYALSAN
jgi:tetratricopeptide (TPR) repeat protein